MYLRFKLLIILSILIFSCNKNEEKEVLYSLLFDAENSSISEPFFRDSILVVNREDSIIIKNYYGENHYQNIYLKCNSEFFEKRYVSNLPEHFFGIDTIITFAQKDTSFVYKSKRDDFIVTLIDLSLFNSYYIIQRNGNNYMTIKQSCVDTTYKEMFYYDKDYNIYKFINTWNGDTIVYLTKK